MASEIELEFYGKIKPDEGMDLTEFVKAMFNFYEHKEMIAEVGKKIGPTSKLRVREIIGKQTKYFFCVKTNIKAGGDLSLMNRAEHEFEVHQEVFEEFLSSVSDNETKRIRFTSKPQDLTVYFPDGSEKIIKDVAYEFDVYLDKNEKAIPYFKMDIDISHCDFLNELNDDNIEYGIDLGLFPIEEDTVFSSRDPSKKELKEKIWMWYKGEGEIINGN